MTSYSNSTRALSLLLSILISSLLVPAAFSVKDFYLTGKCSSGSQNYTKNSTGETYANNLKNLFAVLNSSTPLKDGFSNASTGQDPDRAYGLSLCRGDISKKGCATCLSNATRRINATCHQAIAWFDFCLLKYSDQDFIGRIDTDNRLALVNVKDADNATFSDTTIELLNNLTKNAIEQTKMFSNATVKGALGNETLYGFVQCTRDLSVDNCKQCLGHAINDLKTCCVDKIGGRVLYGSCQVRYEIYRFLKS